MARLHRGDVIDRDASRMVRGWLAANTDLSMVASAWDLDPLAHAEPDRGIRLVNKTGTISTARADVGVVEGPAATIAYAVLANWPAAEDRRDDVLADMRRIGRAIRAHLER
jgi:beta-lactamase class A